jgi:hypothetical protein
VCSCCSQALKQSIEGQQAATKEEASKSRGRKKGRIRELEEIRSELVEKELVLLGKEKELLDKDQTVQVLREEVCTLLIQAATCMHRRCTASPPGALPLGALSWGCCFHFDSGAPPASWAAPSPLLCVPTLAAAPPRSWSWSARCRSCSWTSGTRRPRRPSWPSGCAPAPQCRPDPAEACAKRPVSPT